ncbi:MAG: BrnT family toxin [Pyrinomonadaceae bacterium]
MRVAGFDWDEANIAKCQKHGVSIEEIEQVFINDPYWRVDAEHSHNEERFIAIGRPDSGRYTFVWFTFRSKLQNALIRPIGARFMHSREIKKYEKTIAEIQNR